MMGTRDKPKGMRWQTFDGLRAVHDSLVGQYLAGMTQNYEGLERYVKYPPPNSQANKHRIKQRR